MQLVATQVAARSGAELGCRLGVRVSLRVLARDVMSAYGSRHASEVPEWPPLSVQYADYSLWQHELLGSAEDPDAATARQVELWTAKPAGAPDLLELPADRSRPTVASGRGAVFGFEIPGDVHVEVVKLACAQGVSNHGVACRARRAAVAAIRKRPHRDRHAGGRPW